MVMEAATEADSMMLEQHVDFLQGALFMQICQPIDYRISASVKNHNELLRCFAVLGLYFILELFNTLPVSFFNHVVILHDKLL